MILTNVQFARAGAFFLALRMVHDSEKFADDEALPTEVIKSMQDLTVERSNTLASELRVSFPDETERETAESVARYLSAYDAGKSWQGLTDKIEEPSPEQLAQLAEI